MKINLIRILFCSIIPIGIYTIVQAVILLRKIFSGKIITEFPFNNMKAEFEITKPGLYSIWERSQFAKLLPPGSFDPRMQNAVTGENNILKPSRMGPNVNSGLDRRMQLFSFQANAGRYKIEFNEVIEMSKTGNINLGFQQNFSPTENKYFIQIRESRSGYFIPLAVFLIIISFGCIVCGLIFGVFGK